MLLLLSDDHFFIKAFKKNFNNEKIQQLNTVKFNRQHSLAVKDDVLVLDIANLDVRKFPTIQCAAVALSNKPEYIEAMQILRYGFRGYGNKYMLAENLKHVLQTIRTGQVWLPPVILSTMISKLPQERKVNNSKIDFELTKRESEVAKLVAKGLSNKEISKKMNITIRTTKSHLTSIFNKSGFRDRLELAINYN